MSDRNYSESGWPDWTPTVSYVTAFKRGMFLGAVAMAVGVFAADRAYSGDTADYGGTGCTLVPVSGQNHVAELRCTNVETSGQSLVSADLTAGSLTVTLVIQHGPGNVPDQFTATSPGYIAEPQTLILDEWTSGTVRIFEFVGS